jgi:adenylosuccinate lyase
MVARLADSELYAHLWGTDELRAVFDEKARLQSWLDILVALAQAQAELGLVPVSSAEAIEAQAKVGRLDLAFAAEETRRTSHSTLGLIHALQRILPPEARQHVYVGATVQDVTDTWTALVTGKVGAIAWRDLRTAEALVLDLAERHRDAVMIGRTHGQPGAPITFGYKAAGWADEIRRHLDRLQEGRSRWLVGQLAGAVGVLGFFGADGLRLRAAFCHRLGLGDPGISWLTSRDRIAEFAHLLAMISGTLARIGAEVYELQRPEIGELHEPASPTAVSSITMPHKRNPEGSEHLDTLARLVRANASVLLEGMSQPHERDGRAWKAEWIALPEVCLLTGTALQLAITILAGLEVDTEAMARNVLAQAGHVSSERVLSALSERFGKHEAQALLQDALRATPGTIPAVVEALRGRDVVGEDELRALVDSPAVESAAAMVDEVVRRARAARTVEVEAWP